MNILLYDIGSFTQKDLIYYLRQAGCNCRNVLYKMNDIYQDEFFERKFREQLAQGSYDFVMSTNFFPLVAKICFDQHIKYISWIYDSPINAERIEYYQYPTSFIFLFDRIETERIIRLGGQNIYHLPLAANFERLSKITVTKEDQDAFACDISFVGNFYESPLKQLMTMQNDYDKGYIDAIVDTQLRVYGYNFIEEMISDELVDRMNEGVNTHGCKVEGLTKRGVIHSIATLVTRAERLTLVNLLSQSCNLRYYSGEQPKLLSHIEYRGSAYYFSEMPKIFKLSKLNLNPTLKSIQSGIPLRVLDILGCGGVLLSNYQPELAEYFIDGEDVIMYDSIEDALCKADYYLKHDDARMSLAHNGLKKAVHHFSYPDKISSMLKTAGII